MGRTIPGVISLPLEVVRGSDEVIVVSEGGEIDIRQIEVLRRESDRILVSAGIEAGERVVTGPLTVAVECMLVRVLQEPPQSQQAKEANEERGEAFASEILSGSRQDFGADTPARRQPEPEPAVLARATETPR